ncbi:MAG: acyl-CoA thioesterase [Glaciecola sp.]|jgi:acyl-CoA thioesterase
MLFEQLMQQAQTESEFSVNTSWGQGRTLFGGMSAALALQNISQQVDKERSLRSLAVNFTGQTLADTTMSIAKQTLSAGKSISQINGHVLQNDRVVTQVCACFGINRDSNLNVNSPQIELPVLGTHQRLSYIKGITPEFVQHFEFEYCKGQFPFTNSPLNELAGWVRFKEAGGEFTEAHLIAVIDAWPPTVLQKLKSFAPCATVSWNIEIVQPLSLLKQPIPADDWLYYEAEIKQAHHGFAHTEAKIYNSDGLLLALSRQLVAVYD